MEAPQQINDETYAIPTFFPAGPFGFLPINWYLIKAKEPILVDTGVIIERDDFVKTLGSMVDPKDIKWIFLTHDNHDHSGNLQEVMMELAPKARLVANLLSPLRLGDTWEVPMNRIYAVNAGQSFTAGDRQLGTVRPPIFDSPSSIALYDGKTETLFPQTPSADLYQGQPRTVLKFRNRLSQTDSISSIACCPLGQRG